MPCCAGHQSGPNNGAAILQPPPLPPAAPPRQAKRKPLARRPGKKGEIACLIGPFFEAIFACLGAPFFAVRLSDYLECSRGDQSILRMQTGVHECTIDLVQITRIGGGADCLIWLLSCAHDIL